MAITKKSKVLIMLGIIILVILFFANLAFGKVTLLERIEGYQAGNYWEDTLRTPAELGKSTDTTTIIVRNDAIRKINGEDYLCLITGTKYKDGLFAGYHILKMKLEKVQLGPAEFHWDQNADWTQIQGFPLSQKVVVTSWTEGKSYKCGSIFHM